MIVIREREYQKDNLNNHQERFVVVSSWKNYKECLLGKRATYPNISLPGGTLWHNLFEEIRDTGEHLEIEYQYNNFSEKFIHTADIVKTRSFSNELVVVIDEFNSASGINDTLA